MHTPSTLTIPINAHSLYKGLDKPTKGLNCVLFRVKKLVTYKVSFLYS